MTATTKLLYVLSVLLAALGIVSLVLSQTVAGSVYGSEARKFAQAFAPGSGTKTHAELFDEAQGLHESLAKERVGRMSLSGGVSLAVGLLLLCWAVDRGRLLAGMPRRSRLRRSATI